MSSSRTEAQPPPSSLSPITSPAWMTLISGVPGPVCWAQGGRERTPEMAKEAEQTHFSLGSSHNSGILFLGHPSPAVKV